MILNISFVILSLLFQQQQHMVAQQVRATNNRSTTPKARNTSTPGLQQQHTSQRAQRTATPNHTVQQQMVSPGAGGKYLIF